MKTFYLAGPSAIREECFQRGMQLCTEFDLEWEWCWPTAPEDPISESRTRSSPENEAMIRDVARPGLVLRDLDAAANADLFVLCMDRPSFGGAIELGARLEAGKKAFVILEGAAHHLFLEHPRVEVFDTWADFMNVAHLLTA